VTPTPSSVGQVVGLVLSELLLLAALGIHLLLATATGWSLRGCAKPPWMALWVWLPVVALLGVSVVQIVVFLRQPGRRRVAVVVAALAAALATATSWSVAYQLDMAQWCG
jgi:hypothetical protein